MNVYKFVETDTNEVVYVGKTNKLDLRHSSHFSSDRRVKYYLMDKNYSLYYQEYENSTDANIMEIYYINKYFPKLNIRDNHGEQTTFNLKEREWIESFNSKQDKKTRIKKQLKHLESEIYSKNKEINKLKEILQNLI